MKGTLAKRHRTLLTVFLAVLLSGTAAAATKNLVQGVDVEASGDGRIVRIRTTAEPTFRP